MYKFGNSSLVASQMSLATLHISDSEDNDLEYPEPGSNSLGFSSFLDLAYQNRKKIQPRKPKFKMLLKNMIAQNSLPSVQVNIGDQFFQCQKIVMQCYSRLFREFHRAVLLQLPEEKVAPDTFIKIYSWMLNDNPIVQPQGIMKLFVAARYLKIDHLVRQCWFCFSDSDCFPEDAAFMMYLEANKAGEPDLEQMLLARVCKFFLTAVASRDFLDLSKSQICGLLSSSAIGVHSELEVLMAAVRWLTHDWDKREQFVILIAKCIRFNLMQCGLLLTLFKGDVSPEVLQFIKHPEVKNMISKGLSIYDSKTFYRYNKEELQDFYKRMQLPTHPPRVLICDTLCDYHHCNKQENIQNTSYEIFQQHLGIIRTLGKEHWKMVQVIRGAGQVTPNRR